MTKKACGVIRTPFRKTSLNAITFYFKNGLNLTLEFISAYGAADIHPRNYSFIYQLEQINKLFNDSYMGANVTVFRDKGDEMEFLTEKFLPDDCTGVGTPEELAKLFSAVSAYKDDGQN